MNNSTDIASGNKVVTFSNKYKINKGKLSYNLHIHFTGVNGTANDKFFFTISKIKKLNANTLQGKLTYLLTPQDHLDRTYKTGPKVTLLKINIIDQFILSKIL